MAEVKDTENQEVENKVSAKQRWNDNFKKRHADIDPADEEAYYGAVNADYDDYDNRIKGYEDDNQKVADMLNESPAFAEMLVESYHGGNPWKVLARIGGEPLLELMKDPDNNELAQQVMEGMNEYAEKVKKSKELEKQASENAGPSIDALMEVVNEHGADEETATKMFELWNKIQSGAIVNNIDKETWEMLYKAVTHDENVNAAEIEGEMRGRNAKMQIEKNHILRSARPNAMRGQGGGPRPEGAGKYAKALGIVGKSVWDTDRENEE